MKHLEATKLNKFSNFLDHLDIGYTVLCGNFHFYACKLSPIDRPLFRQINRELQNICENEDAHNSPFGPLSKKSSRNAFIHLILALNHVYPDYDFSFLKTNDFEEDLSFEATLQTHLSEASKIWEKEAEYKDNKNGLIDEILKAIDEVIDLRHCNVYSHNQSIESDLYENQHVLWDFNIFFYNKRLNKVLLFDCREMTKSPVSTDTYDDSSDYDGITTSSDWDQCTTDYNCII